MSTVLVTGATGFVGSNVTQKLAADGYTVYAFFRHSSRRDLKALSTMVEKIRFIEGDLTEYHSIQSAIEQCNPEAIIHLGALTPVRFSFTNPYSFLRVNFFGTVNVIHSIMTCNPQIRLIAASTAEVYGWQPKRELIREDTPHHPSSPYGVSKSAADEYLQMARKVYGVQSTILRCSNTYGRLNEKNFLVEYVITNMLRGDPVYLGAPDHVRDYMFIDDHVNAYIMSLENEKAVGQVFNVSPGNPLTNLELARRAVQIIDYKGNIITGSYPPGYPMRSTKLDTDYIALDSSKIRKTLGWVPSVTLEGGIQRTIDIWNTFKMR